MSRWHTGSKAPLKSGPSGLLDEGRSAIFLREPTPHAPHPKSHGTSRLYEPGKPADAAHNFSKVYAPYSSFVDLVGTTVGLCNRVKMSDRG